MNGVSGWAPRRRTRVVATAITCGTVVLAAACGERSRPRGDRARVAAVAVAPIERGPIVLKRVYSGTLEAPDRFVIASKVGGRLERLTVDLGDVIVRGQLIAVVDDDELQQIAAQANATLAVAKAQQAKARAARLVARRERSRIETLRKRGVSSESQLDAARAAVLQAEADFEVAKAEVARASAALDAAKIRLAYTQITAEWEGGDDRRVVADRRVSAGATVKENDPIATIVELDPITCVLFVAEKDYGRIQVGLPAVLTTDAFGQATFTATVSRIAPVFDPGSRQARVELVASNADHRLKPGMFVRATLTLARINDATVVPFASVTKRNDRLGIFVVSDDAKRVRWQPVELGIRDRERQQLVGIPPGGRVVTLGQQLLDDGSLITVPMSASGEASPSELTP